MSVIISNGNTTLSTASGFYRVEAYNIGLNITAGGNEISLTAPRYIDLTFANAGNCLGAMLAINTVSMTSKQLIIDLEEMKAVTSVDISLDTITINSHGFSSGQEVSFSAAVMMGGVTAGIKYYVINPLINIFQISTTLGGSAVNISSTGTSVVCGALRATKTLSTVDIAGSASSGTYQYQGQYLTAFNFVSGYAVDTSASKWRLRISGGTGTGQWNLICTDATSPIYAVWCDTALSFTNNDVLIVKDYVTIDQSATFGGVVGTGSTAYGVSIVVCSNSSNPLPADVCYLLWDDTPSGIFTMTLGASIMFAAYSGFRVGTSTNRIPVSAQAIIKFTAATVGTIDGAFRDINISSSSGHKCGMASLFFYGEIPTYAKTNLSSDAAVGQANLTCTDSVDWVNNDYVVIGKQYVKGQGDTTIYQVSSVSSNVITLQTNILTNIRKAGATVIRLGGYGIRIENTNATPTTSTCHIMSMANFVCSGVKFWNVSFQSYETSYYYYVAGLGSAYRSQWIVQDCMAWSNIVTSGLFMSLSVPVDGAIFQRFYCWKVNVLNIVYSHFANGMISGSVTIEYSSILSHYSSPFPQPGTLNNRVHVHDCTFENSANLASFIYLHGIECSFYNNIIWGHANTSSGAIFVGQYISPLNISNNKYNYNALALGFGAYADLKCIDTGSIFGDEYPNTTDIKIFTENLSDYVFRSPSGNLVIDETSLTQTITGNKIAFSTFNLTSNDDRVYTTYGKFQRCGDGLTDTTVHTIGSGKFSLRCEPLSSTNLFKYEFDIPTGNIQNKAMAVGVWIKMNNAAFYAGTHQKPRLHITYDVTTETYVEMAGNTSWQYLSIVFTPLSATGKIIFKIDAKTDALTTNAYFYIDDMAILYPAGYKLDLGGIDIWNDGLPVTPPIATVLSALDVWSALDTVSYGANSMGENLKKKLTTSKYLALK